MGSVQLCLSPTELKITTTSFFHNKVLYKFQEQELNFSTKHTACHSLSRELKQMCAVQVKFES